MKASTKGRGPGQWWPNRNGSVMTATYYCPDCGEPMSLSNHGISADGVVTPSVVAPTHAELVEHKRCGFHDFVTLNGWVAP